jgi:hypothetical protein
MVHTHIHEHLKAVAAAATNKPFELTIVLLIAWVIILVIQIAHTVTAWSETMMTYTKYITIVAWVFLILGFILTLLLLIKYHE